MNFADNLNGFYFKGIDMDQTYVGRGLTVKFAVV